MALNLNRIEFNLTIKKYGTKGDPYPYKSDQQEEEVLEELNFKSLSAVEVIRKVLDYFNPYF